MAPHTLNQASIAEHVATRSELLQFGFYYKELVDRYPDQELLIRSLIATSERHSIQSALEADNWAIICYNVDLIEENESNLLYSLQSRIDNYKVIRLITTTPRPTRCSWRRCFRYSTTSSSPR